MNMYSLTESLGVPRRLIVSFAVAAGSLSLLATGCGEVGTQEQREQVACVPRAIEEHMGQGLTWEQARDAAATICSTPQ